MKEFLSLVCEWLVGKKPTIPRGKAAVGYVNVMGYLFVNSNSILVYTYFT